MLGNIEADGTPKRSSDSEEFALISLRAKSAGGASLLFQCVNGEVTDSNIFASRYGDVFGEEDVINCSSLQNAQYRIVGGEVIPGEPTCDECGKCVGLPEPPNYSACKACTGTEGNSWTPIGCLPNTAAGFVNGVLRFLLPIAGGFAFLGIIWGGFLLITSKGEAGRIKRGRSILVGSIGALLLILFALMILRMIGITILGIPGFG